MYPAEIVMPMKGELVEQGFADLKTPEAVDEAMKQSGTTLLDDQFCLRLFCRYCSSRCADGGT